MDFPAGHPPVIRMTGGSRAPTLETTHQAHKKFRQEMPSSSLSWIPVQKDRALLMKVNNNHN